MTDNGVGQVGGLVRSDEVAALAERLEGFDAFQNKTALEDAEWILSDGSRFLSPAASKRQAAIEEAARTLLVEIAAYGLHWDEDVEGCRFCESRTAEHEPGCRYAALRAALAIPEGVNR